MSENSSTLLANLGSNLGVIAIFALLYVLYGRIVKVTGFADLGIGQIVQAIILGLLAALIVTIIETVMDERSTGDDE